MVVQYEVKNIISHYVCSNIQMLEEVLLSRYLAISIEVPIPIPIPIQLI